MFFSSPLSDQQIAKEQRRAEDAGLGFQVTDTVVMRDDIESAAPPYLSPSKWKVSVTPSRPIAGPLPTWPKWWEPETTYAFSDGRDLAKGEVFPTESISAKEWKVPVSPDVGHEEVTN